MNAIIQNNINEITQLCRKHKVKYLYVFGSVCSDRFNLDSDVDFLVSFQEMDFIEKKEHFFELAEALEKILKRRVDLITDKSLHNPYFIESINLNKALIYGTPS